MEVNQAADAAMTPEQFDLALEELGWKAVDFTRKTGLVPNTAWRWRKGITPIPVWVPEYLGAVLEIQRLYARFVAIQRPDHTQAPEIQASEAGLAS